MIDLKKLKRDDLMKHFLPGQAHLADHYISYKMQVEVAMRLLGSDTPQKRLGIKYAEPPDEAPNKYLHHKESSYHQKYEKYSRIFDLCRVLGITNVYDIGCETINQSFLLATSTNMSYTGMDSFFALNDWCEEDEQNNNYWHCYVEEAPPPLCEGRIRFIKGRYPDTGFDVKPNHIAVASCSLTMCRGADSINRAAAALVRDFDRILMNFPRKKFRAEDYECWKNADWSGYEIHPIDYSGFIYATRYEADIERMKVMYPLDEDGIFDTGITDCKKEYMIIFDEPPFYADWVRKKEC